jgi:mono/diheme cytochrome c family protein
MKFCIALAVGVLASFAAEPALAGPVTSAPDPSHGAELAGRLCSNCHLVDASQNHANVDVPSFQEIANKEGQTAGSIMANIMLPKHPMPTIPLTTSEVGDLAAYIMTLRAPAEQSSP